MNTDLPANQAPVSWGSALAGIPPFVAFGLVFILTSILIPPTQASDGAQLARVLLFLLGSYLVPLLGLGIGWARGFPRWSYPYLGFSAIISLYLGAAFSPMLNIIGRRLGLGNMLGAVACVPMLLAFAPLVITVILAHVFTRSANPIEKLFSDVRRDWTRLTFLLFGWAPLIAFIAFDEIENSYEYPYQFLLIGIMAATSLAYLRSASQRGRVLSLLVGIVLFAGVSTYGPIGYWLPKDGVNVPGSIFQGMLLVIFMFTPALIGLLPSNTGSRAAA